MQKGSFLPCAWEDVSIAAVSHHEEGLRLGAGGNTCVSFSPPGQDGSGPNGGSVAVLGCVLCRHGVSRTHIMFDTENVFLTAFPPDHSWCTSVVGLAANDVGVPMNRRRNFSWTIRSDQPAPLGPLDDLAAES